MMAFKAYTSFSSSLSTISPSSSSSSSSSSTSSFSSSSTTTQMLLLGISPPKIPFLSPPPPLVAPPLLSLTPSHRPPPGFISISVKTPSILSRQKYYTSCSALWGTFKMKLSQSSAKATEKLVLITGITKGLGRALALELAARGHKIVGCGRNEEKLALLQAQLDGEPKHLLKAADVASESSVQEFAKFVLETSGAPDILVNNAGIINGVNKLWEVPSAEFDAVIDINVKGTANMMRHFLPSMIAKKHGVVVNFSSGWGRTVSAEVAPYCASKWAIEGLSKAVAKEVPQGIAVVALNPGVINTDMLATCFGASASLYPTPESWAPHAANVILGITAEDNGASLNV